MHDIEFDKTTSTMFVLLCLVVSVLFIILVFATATASSDKCSTQEVKQ